MQQLGQKRGLPQFTKWEKTEADFVIGLISSPPPRALIVRENTSDCPPPIPTWNDLK